jgi:hypothetical protein
MTEPDKVELVKVVVGWYCEKQHQHGPRRKIGLEPPCHDALPLQARVRRRTDGRLP